MDSTSISTDRRAFVLAVTSAGLSACTFSPTSNQQIGKVNRLEVHKSSRRMHAFLDNGKRQSFDVSLGFSPVGHKSREGDGKTPVGSYVIDRKNPQSQFHLSLGISYPNEEDVRSARSRGVDPGGDIFIHGQPNRSRDRQKRGDWTYGCIAVTNEEMDLLFNAVSVGTPIHIYH